MGARHIMRKDLLVLTRDRRALGVRILMPLAFIAILGFSTGKLMGWQNENAMLRLAWVDSGADPLIGAIIGRLEQRGGVEVTVTEDLQTAGHASTTAARRRRSRSDRHFARGLTS